MTEEEAVKLITPKYLSVTNAALAVEEACAVAMRVMPGKLERRHCHIVVLVPGMEDASKTGYHNYPNYPIQPVCLYETSFGEPEAWDRPYDRIAQCKALQLWTRRHDGRTGSVPHFLFPGDTPFWGGVRREEGDMYVVVACSGVQSHFDKMISGIAADIFMALAYDAYENDEERKSGADFLT